ncbi:NAD(P)-dependent alcohol dehydrogenase [Leucobacter triazinivorans]|uniref:NAD(P)-dependent alcohol dehydrogenase n=1 Tax=Leucobacter triazinivorans TaxID=1784719 RepID=A0A4P6KF66_9MICO|nr:NAD(P)-dependent alcohol dehydrogenase [Leucobacter triazinivorans]QBE48790.1 NAD(P)-dependent alcohol dehydrogenase [Leucobacter triazinivorans]
MQAALAGRYGPPETLRIAEIPTPEPRAHEVLVRVVATPVTAGDARIRAGRFPRGFGLPARLALGLRGPRRRVLGAVCSGVIERTGSAVDRFAPGDAVVGMTGGRMGAHAEYAVIDAERLVPKPVALSHDAAAAALFGGTTALYFLRDRVGLHTGQRLLVNGASGSVGSAAVQLGRALGAEVTAVTSGRNRELATELGAAEVIDYTTTPIVEWGGDSDVVFDAVGTITRSSGQRLLAPGGALVLAVASLADTIRARGRVFAGPAPERAADFELLLDLVARGRFDPVVRTLDGLDAIPEAHRIVDSGRKIGNLVVRLAE